MSERARKMAGTGQRRLHTAYSSRQGTAHLKEGTPNQDSVLVTNLSLGPVGPVAVMAVSDGAGSAKYSHFSSRAACLASVSSLTRQLKRNPAIAAKEHLLRSALQRAVRRARRAVVTTAGKLNRPGGSASVNECACTLMLALASPRLVGIAHVGDGCVVAGDGQEWRLLSEPDNGEFANETKFLTNPRNLPRVAVVSCDGLDCLAVITDGLQDVALSRNTTPFKRFWSPLYRALNRDPLAGRNPVLDALLQKAADAGKATDDCTIAVCMIKDE